MMLGGQESISDIAPTARDVSGQQNPSAENTSRALKSLNFRMISSGPEFMMTS